MCDSCVTPELGVRVGHSAWKGRQSQQGDVSIHAKADAGLSLLILDPEAMDLVSSLVRGQQAGSRKQQA